MKKLDKITWRYQLTTKRSRIMSQLSKRMRTLLLNSKQQCPKKSRSVTWPSRILTWASMNNLMQCANPQFRIAAWIKFPQMSGCLVSTTPCRMSQILCSTTQTRLGRNLSWAILTALKKVTHKRIPIKTTRALNKFEFNTKKLKSCSSKSQPIYKLITAIWRNSKRRKCKFHDQQLIELV